MEMIKNFARDEDGAVTVDWVVLTSAIVGLGVAVMLSVGNSTQGLADKISSNIDSRSVWDYSGDDGGTTDGGTTDGGTTDGGTTDS